MSGLSDAFNSLDGLTAEIQSYVVAPMAAFGLGGFVFDAEGESTAMLRADITDHYMEDNRAFQDHIAVHPKRVTLKGYVGEVVYKPDEGLLSDLASVPQKITEYASYLPALSSAASQAQDIYDGKMGLSDISLSDASSLYGLVQGLIGSAGDQAAQQSAYTYFKSLMNQGILMGIQTPWEFMTNMAIESVTAIQSEQSKYITDFQVTLKEIRIAKVKKTKGSDKVDSEQLADNSPTETVKDAAGASGSGESILDKAVSAGRSAVQSVGKFIDKGVQIGSEILDPNAVSGIQIPFPAPVEHLLP